MSAAIAVPDILARPLTIGSVTIPGRVFLAPMSGVSDRPFRDIAARYGASLVISEMVASELLVQGDPETRLRAERAGAGPHVVQLAGREERWMAEGARAAEAAGADIIDINMGCPAKKVTSGYSGSHLMRDLDHAARLMAATVGATTRPVTLKMRLGWDDRSLVAPELARRAEALGVRLVTVHGRTRCQFYTGKADWAAIRAVKDAISIPLIANGDLVSIDQLEPMLAASGADGLMIGRGAYGRPWWPGMLAKFAMSGRTPSAPRGSALVEIISGHFEAMLDHYGPRIGLRVARKHLSWYLDRHLATDAGKAIRSAIVTADEPRTVLRLVAEAFALPAERRAA